MKRKSLLSTLIKMVIPNLVDLNMEDGDICELDYMVGNQRYRISCSLSEYERAADPQLFINRSLDQIYAGMPV